MNYRVGGRLKPLYRPYAWEKWEITESQSLKLSFMTRELRRICLDPDYAVRKLGAEVGGSLQARLADLDAADHLTDVPIGIDLASSTLACVPIQIVNNHYLIGRADHVKVYGSDTPQAPWDMVSRIKLTHIQEMPR